MKAKNIWAQQPWPWVYDLNISSLMPLEAKAAIKNNYEYKTLGLCSYIGVKSFGRFIGLLRRVIFIL